MRNSLSSEEMVPDQLKSVAKKVSDFLREKNIPHALAGGIAAGKYSNPRTTSDVDFVVSSDAEDAIRELGNTSPLEAVVPGITANVDGVEVDFLYAPDDMPESAYSTGEKFDGIPVLAPEAFILMKLLAGRIKDTTDIVEIFKAGKVDKEKVKKYIKRNKPDQIEDFEALVALAEFEKSRGDKFRKSSINPDELVEGLKKLAAYLSNSPKPSFKVASNQIRKFLTQI